MAVVVGLCLSGVGNPPFAEARGWKKLLPSRPGKGRDAQAGRRDGRSARGQQKATTGRLRQRGERLRLQARTLRPQRRAPVEAIALYPRNPRAVMVLAHGSGGSMKTDFMASMAVTLAQRGIATLRFNFGYMQRRENGDPEAKPNAREDYDIIRAALEDARQKFPGVPVYLGGKSRGGVLTSLLASAGGAGPVDGVVMLGLPLHDAEKKEIGSAEHLDAIRSRKLIVQGSDDPLGDLGLVRRVAARTGAELHTVRGGDHSYRRVMPGDQRNQYDDALVQDAGHAVADWIAAQ